MNLRKMLKSSMFWMLILTVAILTACSNSDSSSDNNDSSSTNDTSSNSDGNKESGSEEAGKVSIEFWHAMSGTGQESIDAIVKGFNESQDKYEVKAEFQGSYE